MVQYGRSSRSSWTESVRSSFGRTIMGKAIWENPIKARLANSFSIVSLCTVKKGLFLSVYVDDIKLAGKKQNLDPMWKLLDKEVDLGEPTSFLDHVYLGCTQRQCQTSKDNVDNYRTMFESRISAVWTEKLRYSENFRISSWSFDVEGHAKNCVERYCELANKTTQQLYKVSTPCIDDHHLKEEETKSVGELSQVHALKLFWNASSLARIGRPDILWSVNKIARSITKWTKACDKRLNRLISYIHHTCEYKQYCYVGNTDKQCRRAVSRLWFCRRLWRFDVNIRRNSVHFRKSHVCSSKLDVQETDFSFTQFNRSWSHLFRWMLVYVWMVYLLSIFGTWWLKFYMQPKTKLNPNVVATRKLGQFLIPKPRPNMSQENRRLTNWVRWITYPPTHILLTMSLSFTIFLRQWSCNQNDNQRTKSNNETRVKNSQSCAWFVVR